LDHPLLYPLIKAAAFALLLKFTRSCPRVPLSTTPIGLSTREIAVDAKPGQSPQWGESHFEMNS
jgi:hypothetical protein